MNSNDNRVFAPSNTGTKAHAFLGSRGAKEGNLRAACRTTIQRKAVGTTFFTQAEAETRFTLCDNCVKLYAAAEARAESSMQPATEADDLGYVTPVDGRTEAPQPACTMGERPAERRETATTTEAPQPAAGTEADPVRVGRDILVRTSEHWGLVTLATGRTYVVSLKVRRKANHGTWRVLFDNVTYWSERDGRSFGPTRSAGTNDQPGSVGGRIWALLVAAGIA